jgi:hypothetical protein
MGPKPLEAERWAGAIDNGREPAGRTDPQHPYGRQRCCVGLAGGAELHVSPDAVPAAGSTCWA